MKVTVTSETTGLMPSSRDKYQDYQINVDANTCDCIAGSFGKPCYHVEMVRKAIEIRYNETWKEYAVLYINIPKEQSKEAITIAVKCSNCGQDAIFTEEGPNTEYPEPLCQTCEEGENHQNQEGNDQQVNVTAKEIEDEHNNIPISNNPELFYETGLIDKSRLL